MTYHYYVPQGRRKEGQNGGEILQFADAMEPHHRGHVVYNCTSVYLTLSLDSGISGRLIFPSFVPHVIDLVNSMPLARNNVSTHTRVPAESLWVGFHHLDHLASLRGSGK